MNTIASCHQTVMVHARFDLVTAIVHVRVDLVTELGVCAMQMFNPNPDPADVQKAKEALKVCFTCH